MQSVRFPIDPPVSRPILTQILSSIIVLLICFLLISTSSVYRFHIFILGLFLLTICVMSSMVFSGFVRPKRKLRNPSDQFSRVDWLSKSDELVVRFEKWNDAKAPLIIAIHGWQSDSSSTEYKIKPFIDSGYHIVMIDLPGHGSSDGLKIWTAVESGERILSMLSDHANKWDESKIEKIVLFGHSIGGFVVLRHANRMSQILPMPISRVYLESPMTSFPLVFKQRTASWKLISRMLAQLDLRWAFIRDGPGSEIVWKDFEVPGWGIPSMPIRILQAKDDIALGQHHLDLLRPYEMNNWEVIIDSNLKHFGRGENRGNASMTYEDWITK